MSSILHGNALKHKFSRVNGDEIKSHQLHPLERVNRNRYLMMLVPAMILLFVFFLWPLAGMIGRSFFTNEITLHNYALIFDDSIYFMQSGLPFRMAAIVTAISVFIGYPVAYVLAHTSLRMRGLPLIAVILPISRVRSCALMPGWCAWA